MTAFISQCTGVWIRSSRHAECALSLHRSSFLSNQPRVTQRCVVDGRSSQRFAFARASLASTDEAVETASDVRPDGQPERELDSTRMFSNIQLADGGKFKRVESSEMACSALVAGTMIGAGVLALPTVAAPAGFLPSSAALIGVWVYMVATGLLISEVSINTACSLGRPSGVSLLSLGELTLGKPGAIVTAASYTLLHYAILTAYTSQGGAMLNQLFQMLESTLGIPISYLSPIIPAAIFASTVGGCMYALPGRAVQNINNILVVGVLTTFLSILGGAGAHLNAMHLLDGTHWQALGHGEILPVLFVSCVYHNIVSTITMRLEGDRRKIRRVIVGGSAVPLLMFLLYDAVMLGNSGGSNAAQLGVAAFSLLAITTSFIGFVEGLTELWTDVRLSALKESERQVARSTHVNFLATIVPPFVFTAVSPDIFLRALDAAGTYGIAVLFGALPAAMAWRNRRAQMTAGFRRLVGGGDAVLAAVAIVPVLLIGSRIAETVGIL